MIWRTLLVFLFAAGALFAAERTDWQRVAVTPMKTSVYIGSVRLKAGEFVRDGDTFASTYEAKVTPWFFWSEHGEISIRVSADELTRLAAGESIEFAGDAKNHKGKPRRVSGRAEPTEDGGANGRIKVRIHVDDVTLVFNGDYRASR